MPFLIGTDEAGYGPNLGPLVITATAWWIDDASTEQCLYRRLRKVVCKKPPGDGKQRRLAIADSKQLYKSGDDLKLLERGVLAALGLLDCWPVDWREFWQQVDSDSELHVSQLPWHVGYERPLPCAADRDDLVAVVGKLRRGCQSVGVRLVAIRSTAIFPERFNAATEEWGNKAEALSRCTLALVGQMLDLCAGEAVFLVCDKHGGRNRYGRLLQQQFPDPLIEVRQESLRESVYRWQHDGRPLEACFRAGGESFFPTALASMVSKYLRELTMQAFNDFWRTRLPDLRPTAGYPGDSRRFKKAIASTQSELGIDDRVLWRAR